VIFCPQKWREAFALMSPFVRKDADIHTYVHTYIHVNRVTVKLTACIATDRDDMGDLTICSSNGTANK